jgi:hypothetical protein
MTLSIAPVPRICCTPMAIHSSFWRFNSILVSPAMSGQIIRPRHRSDQCVEKAEQNNPCSHSEEGFAVQPAPGGRQWKPAHGVLLCCPIV